MAGAKHRKRGSREESAFLELVRTTDILSRRVSQTLEKEELSGTQYNVLRVLRVRMTLAGLDLVDRLYRERILLRDDQSPD